MKIEVLNYVLETEFMSGHVRFDLSEQSKLHVWLKFEDSKDLSVVSFGVLIPAKEYTPEEFQEAVYCEALESIKRMQKNQAEDHAKAEELARRKTALEDLGARIAKESGVAWMPVGRAPG